MAAIAGAASGSYNLVGDGTGMSGINNGDANHNQVGTSAAPLNPLLGPLQSNGGPTPTMALQAGSPALGKGDVASAYGTSDQRGLPRVVNGAVDVGAFESQGFVLSVFSGSGQQRIVNTLFANPLVVTVSSPFGEPVVGGAVTYTAPSAGASATINPDPVPIDPSGTASGFATANAFEGTYQVTATAAGAAN